MGEPEPKDEYEEAKEFAAHLAKMNRIMYEAHLDAGFDEVDALALTTTMVEKLCDEY
jgi:hypothetical protein